jgi:hypothetical protein
MGELTKMRVIVLNVMPDLKESFAPKRLMSIVNNS